MRRPLFAAGTVLGAAACLLLLVIVVFRRVRRVEVAGDSMRPTLEPGDRLLVLHWAGPGPATW